ncbi:MAG: DUF362 domain-containing protein [Deltaproteobacteria bacterium]|nr:DUF362 domain-containing protein [Deltaproteobacteria bacterium]
MSRVIFKKASYEYEIIKPLVFDMIDFFAGKDIGPGSRVLIKPNFLTPAKPQQAVLTHPLIVKAAAEYVLDKKGCIQICDSPAVGSVKKILKIGGYDKILTDLDIEPRAFERMIRVDIGEPFGKIELAAEAVEADVVINLAKLKTHTQMRLTLGVKNMFGCVVGFRKSEWHLRTGIDRAMFAKLLLQIYQIIKPSVTLVDGILALEGQGPSKSGKPRHLGMLIASDNAVAGDIAICRMLAMQPDRLPTNKAAREMDLVPDTVDIEGDFKVVTDFDLPELGRTAMGPKLLQSFMRKHLLQRPVADQSLCQLCAECWRYCPAKAISHDESRIFFDYDACIRCYCCIEVCPHGALRAVETQPGRLIRRLSLKNK